MEAFVETNKYVDFDKLDKCITDAKSYANEMLHGGIKNSLLDLLKQIEVNTNDKKGMKITLVNMQEFNQYVISLDNGIKEKSVNDIMLSIVMINKSLMSLKLTPLSSK